VFLNLRHCKKALPVIEDRGVSARLILGDVYGQKAPATMFSEKFNADARRRMPTADAGRSRR
jgi:hypothetical protein